MEGRTWDDITDIAVKRSVEEAIEKSLKDRDSEKRDRQIRRKNIIIFGLQESKKNEPEERKEEDVKKLWDLSKTYVRSISART